MATKIPAIPDPGHDPARVLKALKEIVEVREGLRGDPLDAFVSYRNLKDYVVTDEMIVSILGLSHGHGASHISAGTFGSWYSTTPGTYTFPQDLVVSGKLGIACSTTIARLEVEDGGTSAGILVKITQDDAIPWALAIGNDTYSATDTAGLKFRVDNTGYCWIEASGTVDTNILYISTELGLIFLDNNGGSSIQKAQMIWEAWGCSLYLGTNDTGAGVLWLYGNAPGSIYGGGVVLYNAADHDTTVESYTLQAIAGNLVILDPTYGYRLTFYSAYDGVQVEAAYFLLYGGTGTQWAFALTEAANTLKLRASTADGADNQMISICSGGDLGATRGAYLSLGGNESGLPGQILIVTGNVTNNAIYFYTSGILSGTIFTSGGAILALGENDTTFGQMSLYGHGTGTSQGGRLQLYLAADYDTSIALYQIEVVEDDLLIGTDTDTDAIKLDSNKDLYITAGSIVLPSSEYVNFGGTLGSGGYGVRDNTGNVEYKDSGGSWIALNSLGGGSPSNPFTVGTDDTTYGSIYAYGQATASSQGGIFRVYLAADYDATIDYFMFQAYEDDLLIGPNTDTDALKLDSAKDLYLTDGSLYVQNAGVSKFIFDSDLGVMAIQSAVNQYRVLNYDVTISSQFADIHFMTYCNEVHNYTASASKGIIGQFLRIDCNTVSQDIYSVDVLGLTEYIYLRSGTEVNNVTAAKFYVYPLTGSTSVTCIAGDFQILGTTATTGIGVYISVSASSTNWGIRCTASQNYFSGNMLIGDVTLPTSMTKGLSIGAGTAASAVLANAVLLWAEDINAAAGQCGLHMMAESEAVALVVAGIQIKGTTGDPTGHEGKMCINTYDNNLRVYADGSWRSLATW